ncbi:MAG: stage II sporulation protein R [Clostridia bacterium]|nr:stage II sporulation protein R [Clostridia bacterium]MBO5257060.1 stage II sporulation protein R [Clostridia bacterium]MBP3293308.1 stage II sporulation protein R [Clostridia bacterium]
MSILIRLTASVLLSAVLLSVLPIAGEHRIYEDVLRLHVIAESDSADDQALKLKVRDAVLACVSAAVGDCTSFEEANAVVTAMSEEIQSAAEACVRENGGNCSVAVELSPEKYPRRDYGSACLPAGVYQSLRVTLGDGAGKNWWCVLFPTVCIRFARETADEDAYIAAGFTPEEYRIITGNDGGWKIKFRILEILADVFA